MGAGMVRACLLMDVERVDRPTDRPTDPDRVSELIGARQGRQFCSRAAVPIKSTKACSLHACDPHDLVLEPTAHQGGAGGAADCVGISEGSA